ncbi:thiamine pyrophosphate-dependent dehydrogenase E1 component subunit alpha [Luteimonas sp. A501]
MNIESGVLIDIFRRMSLAKQSDERMRASIKSGRLALPYYSARGQECIPAAVSANLRDDDYVCTIYRGMHDALCKGVPVKLLWAEYAGKVTGTCKGKGGPMHITHPASGVMVTTGIVGSSLPIANGLAWASQLSGTDQVTVAYFGDGASNIGAFHEALNLASLWKLPVVFVCQNNRFAEHTRYEKGTAVAQVAQRAQAYSMPGVTLNGNDPVAVYEAARTAVGRARRGDGPTLIEAMTFRLFGHVFGDDDSVMRPGERDQALREDPYPVYRQWLVERGHADVSVLDQIEAAHAAEVNEALRFAMESPYPDIAEVGRDVYAQEVVA